MAKFPILYNYRLAGAAQQNHEDQKKELDAFAKWHQPSDVTFLQFVARVDGQGGAAVVETDNPASLLNVCSTFVTWNEAEVIPVVDITDAVPLVQAGIEFRESV
jgi:hypothetical protein